MALAGEGVRLQHSYTSELFLAPLLLNIVIEVKASRPPHVLRVWLVVNKVTLPVKYFRSDRASFCVSQISWRSLDGHEVEVTLATLSLGDFTGSGHIGHVVRMSVSGYRC